MSKATIACVALFLAVPAFAQTNPNTHTNKGHVTDKGTVVQPYQSTNPNGTQMDNFNTKGNTNPYTGQPGTRTPQR